MRLGVGISCEKFSDTKIPWIVSDTVKVSQFAVQHVVQEIYNKSNPVEFEPKHGRRMLASRCYAVAVPRYWHVLWHALLVRFCIWRNSQ